MKRFITALICGLLLLFHTQPMQAQTVEKLKLKQVYKQDHLDKIIDAIGKDTGVRFIYEAEHLHRYKLRIDPFAAGSNLKTVGSVLDILRKSWDMEVLLAEDGYIYIAEDKTHLQQLQKKNQAATDQRQTLEHKRTVGSGPVKKDFTLTGEIIDKSTSERIPYAMITINGTATGAMTDANGKFTLTKVPADTCTLKVDYIGYLSKEITLRPTPDNDPLCVEIEPQPQDIAAVFIVGRKADKALQAHTQEQKMKMAPEALKLLPNLGEKDILRGFQLMPGVSASNESSSGMYVRGGTPDQNLILYDGFTIYYVDHMHGFYSAFNSNAIKDVQLYKGGYEAKYGGRLSSVTEITAKDGNKKKFTIGGEVSLLSMNAYAEVPIGQDVTTMIAFRRSYQGYLWNHISGQQTVSSNQTAVERPEGFGKMKKGPAYFYDLNAKITYTPTNRDIISVSFFNGADYNDNTPQFGFDGGGPPGMPGGGSFNGMKISMDNADYQRYGNLGTSLRWARKVNDRWSMNLLGSFSYFYATRDQSRTMSVTKNGTTEENTSGTYETNDLYDISLKNDWKYQVNDNNALEFGAFGTRYDIEYSYTQNGDEELLRKRNDAIMLGVYVQDKMKFADNRFILTPGVRANFYTADKKAYFEPRLSASYSLTSNLTVNAATGIFCQFANRIVREDIMSGNTDFWILSDGKEIPVSRSYHYNLGINYDLPDYIFSVEGYYKRNLDISEYTLRYKQNRLPAMGPKGESDTNVSENFYVGDGYATGVEFLAQKKAGKFSGWISYAFGQVRNRFPEQSEKYFAASHDVTHEVKIVGIYKFGNFDVSATWICSTGRPYTAPIGGYQIPSASGAIEDFYAVSDKNTYRLPTYHRLDLSGSFRFNMFKSVGKPNAISVSLFNAYNRRNVSAKQFQIVDGAIMESNINYLSITPNISLTIKF